MAKRPYEGGSIASGNLSAFVGDDVLTVLRGNGCRLLCGDIEEDHHRLALAHHLPCGDVDGALLQGKAFISEAAAAGLHHNLVAIEDGLEEVGLDVSNDGDHRLQAEVGREDLAEVLILPEIVIREVAVVVHMTVCVEVIEAYLDIEFAVKYGFHKV